MKRFALPCSSMPADCSRKTNGPALPSMIGTSSAERSTYALSIPKPANADIKCSTVATFAPDCGFSIRVDIRVSFTFRACARTIGLPGKSVRQNTMPVSGAAGRISISTR